MKNTIKSLRNDEKRSVQEARFLIRERRYREAIGHLAFALERATKADERENAAKLAKAKAATDAALDGRKS
jgi:hypothetical protein